MAYDLVFWIGIAIVIIAVLAIIAIFNGLISRRNQVKNAWSQIDVQLKKRADLIPNLVETVKNYMKYERTTFEEITKARTAVMSASGIREKAKAENMLSGALKTLFAVAENYPDLKASQNFLMLQEELSGIESKVAYARQFYNDSVMDYNNVIQQFPSSAFARLFGFKESEFFEIEEGEGKPVKVKF
ncbi:MAG: LemA family protein [archaeon]